MQAKQFELRYLILATLIWLGCFPTQAATGVVRMGNYWFSPTSLTVNAGDSVRWTNVAVTAHDTTSSSGLWASPAFGGTTTFTYQFNNAGNFPYFCGVHIVAHPEQTGAVTVVSSILAPLVSVTSPADGQDFSTPAAFTFSANATDGDGTISIVQFFVDTTILGEDSSSPYNIGISNLTSGSYSLTARATDNNGLSRTSAPVRITVGTSRLVRMGNYLFSPTNIVVNAGDTVVWTNISATAHDTTSSTGLWASPTFGGAMTFSYRFTNGGYFPYICGVHIVAHPEQTGTVTVVTAPNGAPVAVSILEPVVDGTGFRFSFATLFGKSYQVKFSTMLNPGNWQTLTNVAGNGSIAWISDSTTNAGQRFYRVESQ